MGGMHKHTTSTPSVSLRARLLGALVGALALAGSFAGAACDPEDLGRTDEEIAAPVEHDDDAQPIDDVEQFSSEIDPAGKMKITECSCGTYKGSPLYVVVDCAGYPSTAVCCAEKCGELTAALDGQT